MPIDAALIFSRSAAGTLMFMSKLSYISSPMANCLVYNDLLINWCFARHSHISLLSKFYIEEFIAQYQKKNSSRMNDINIHAKEISPKADYMSYERMQMKDSVFSVEVLEKANIL